MSLSLAGRTVLVTGSTKGIGRATIERLSRDGAFAIINHRRDSNTADALVRQLGGPNHAMAIQADVSKVDDIKHLIDTAISHRGKIDILVANAGILKMVDLASTTEADFDTSFNVNVKGVYFLCQASAPHMPSGGRIVLLSSGVTKWSLPPPQYLLYAATKGAIEQMTRLMGKDLGRKGISVNAISPGPTATPLFLEGRTEEQLNMARKLSPFGQLGEPEQTAELIAMLCAPAMSWVSGQIIGVNGAAHV